MTDTILHDAIHQACMNAYEQGVAEGRKQEREFMWKAIELNSTSNEIDEYVYFNDLRDAITELEGTKNEQ